jgi:hypothetical protein
MRTPDARRMAIGWKERDPTGHKRSPSIVTGINQYAYAVDVRPHQTKADNRGPRDHLSVSTRVEPAAILERAERSPGNRSMASLAQPPATQRRCIDRTTLPLSAVGALLVSAVLVLMLPVAHADPPPASIPPSAGTEPPGPPSKKSAPPPSAKAQKSMDDLLNEAVGIPGSQPPPPPSASSSAPSTSSTSNSNSAPAPAAAPPEPEDGRKPTREQVQEVMQGINPAVQACTRDQEFEPGAVTVAFRIVGATGKPGDVSVTGIEGPIAACIAREVRKAKFPQFSQPEFRVTYPYALQPSVFADDAVGREAQVAFERGVKALDAKETEQALHAFQESYRIQPNPLMGYYIAQAFEALGTPGHARQHYRRFLASDAGTPAQRAEATRASKRLARELARPTEVAESKSREPPPDFNDFSAPPSDSRRIWIAGGITAALLTGAIVTGILANSAEHALVDHSRNAVDRSLDPDTRWESWERAWSASERADAFGVASNVLLGCTIVAAGVTTYFLLRPSESDYASSELRAHARISPDSLGLDLSGSF